MQFLRLIVAGLLTVIVCNSLSAQSNSTASRALFPIVQNDRWGYIDPDGKIVISPQFDYAEKFAEGLGLVEINDKWGFVDETGKLVIEARFSAAQSFAEGLARVQIGGDKYRYHGKWGFIDRTGAFVIAPAYGNMNGGEGPAADFHDGLAMIEVDYKKGFIDKTGQVVIAPRFFLAYHFVDGLAAVTTGAGEKWGFIDKTGRWAISPRFEFASLFSEGLGPVSFNGTCGYVDPTGEMKVKPQFKRSDDDCASTWGSFDGGLSRWRIGDKYGFINKRGEVVIKPDFDLTFNFSEGMAFVEKGGKYGFINETGELVIAPQFYFAKDFHDGLARVGYSADGWGYINKQGEFVWKTTPVIAAERPSDFLQPGHTRDLLFVGWSQDGDLLASYSGGDGHIKIWNPQNGKLLWDFIGTSLKSDRPLKSPDGNLVALAAKDNWYEIKDSASDKTIWKIKSNGTSADNVPSPKGDLIAKRGTYGDACIRLLDAKTNQLIRRLEGHPGIVYANAFSPDGKIVVSGSGDHTIRLWDARTGALQKTLLSHTRPITSLAFSRDGKVLVSGSKDDTIKLWEVSSGQLLRTIVGFTSVVDGISSVDISPDARIVFAGSGNQIKAWETATGKQLLTLETHESHTSEGPHASQMTWCCGSKVVSVAISPDATLLVSSHDDHTVKIWNVAKEILVRTIKGRFQDIRSVRFSPDGKLIATGYHDSDARIDLWSAESGTLVSTLGEDSDYVHSLSFSGDGKLLASGHMADDIKLWNVKTGKLIRQFKQPYSTDDEVAFSPDGKYIFSGGENQNLMLWDVRSGQLAWSVIPIDWEAEKRAEEAAAAAYKIASIAEAEHKRKVQEADRETLSWKNKIEITFDHFGERINPLDQRFLEKGEVNKSLIRQSEEEANGVWLRLRNNSPLPISFRTDSWYLPRPDCAVKLSDGANKPGLCNGAEVSIQYQIEEANGKQVPYGLDMSFLSVLPPGASILFSVSREHLGNGRKIFVGFNYLKENDKHQLDEYGTAKRVSFRR